MIEIKREKMIVVKHNDLIKAAQKMTLMEYRIILCCIAQVNSIAALSADDKFFIHISDMEYYIGDGTSINYAELREAVDLLYERSVYLLQPSERSRKPIEAKIRWVSYIAYLPNEGRIVLSFSHHIIPFISELTKEFTKYKLEHVMPFKKIYSFRFYELLKSWLSSEKYLSIEELRSLLDLESKHEKIDKLQYKVIQPALAEINKFTDIKVDYTTVKQGRSVIGFKFVFVSLEPKQNKSSPKPKFSQDRIDGVLKADLEKYAKPGESYSQAAARIKAEQLMLEKTGKPKTVDVVW